MCGIFCYICSNYDSTKANQTLHSCFEVLNNRGPDYDSTLWYNSSVLFHASVLWHQGDALCKQPLETDRTVLVFNGDIFQKRDDVRESDTLWLLKQIEACHNQDDLLQLVASLRGPFSVIFLRKQENRVYFARDAVGRNSLLFGRSEDGSILISSVFGNVSSTVVYELPPYGLYYIDLEAINDSNPFGLLPWTDDCSQLEQTFGNTISVSWKNGLEKTLSSVKHNFNFHELLTKKESSDEDVFEYLFKTAAISDLCAQLLTALRQSVEERILNTAAFCKTCLQSRRDCLHPKVGILFSGGIDCSILALLADEFVPADNPIELLNVAFEKISRAKVQSSHIDWNVPDRVTGRTSLEELHRLRPNRKWIFVEINVSRNELSDRRQTISNLVYPLQNVLDESLGAALWFASRGAGLENGEPYRSTSRVLLLGSGADELFAGYTRHKTAFERCLRNHGETDAAYEMAFQALEDELNLDWRRLPSRNLARDDRVICDNRVTPRSPYLQEDFIAAVLSLRASQRCYHPLGPGIGDKLILRLCACKLGLTQASTLRKRALQFGSRIADRKQNASDRSVYLND
uniref:Glutamine amidotransferase type-2 domain-containing protein n=1 Tax=Anopheles dirus TaxID=7168 RepID=A0A182NDD6_9DIPT